MEYMNKSLIQKRTKSGPEGAQTLVQKERKGPAGPEKSAATARPTVRVGGKWADGCVIGMYLSTLG